MKQIVMFCLLLTAATALHAQVLTDFSLKNVQDGKTISLKDFGQAQGLVVVFTSVACPFDGYYASRLLALQNAFKDKLPMLLVNSYTEAPEAEQWMIKTAQANSLTLPYLNDKDQVLFAQLGAQRSPEIFVLKNINGVFSVVYQGAIDDNPQAESAVKQTYAKDAIEALLAGKPVVTPSTRPAGCYIRKKA